MEKLKACDEAIAATTVAAHHNGMRASIKSQLPDLVWRAPNSSKSRNSVDVDNSGASRRVARFPPPAASTAPLQEASRAEKVTAPAVVTTLDPALVERLAHDVIRRIERQMRIERERRGL